MFELIGIGAVVLVGGGLGLIFLASAPKQTLFWLSTVAGLLLGLTQTGWGESKILSGLGGAVLGAVLGGLLAGALAMAQGAWRRLTETPIAKALRLSNEAVDSARTDREARPSTSPRSP